MGVPSGSVHNKKVTVEDTCLVLLSTYVRRRPAVRRLGRPIAQSSRIVLYIILELKRYCNTTDNDKGN
jgi:hypothetical protein